MKKNIKKFLRKILLNLENIIKDIKNPAEEQICKLKEFNNLNKVADFYDYDSNIRYTDAQKVNTLPRLDEIIGSKILFRDKEVLVIGYTKMDYCNDTVIFKNID